MHSCAANVFAGLGLLQYSLLKLLFDCDVLQELNNRLAAEITKMRSMTSEDGAGDSGTTIQGKELYELEVRAQQPTAALKILLRNHFSGL